MIKTIDLIVELFYKVNITFFSSKEILVNNIEYLKYVSFWMIILGGIAVFTSGLIKIITFQNKMSPSIFFSLFIILTGLTIILLSISILF